MFLFKNSIFALFSDEVLARSLLTTRPAILSKRSLGTLIAGIASSWCDNTQQRILRVSRLPEVNTRYHGFAKLGQVSPLPVLI